MRRDNLVPPLLLGIAGLCCFPLGLIAGIWGFIAVTGAKRENQQPPVLGFVCVALFGLSILTNSGLLIFAMKQNAEREKKKSAVEEKLKGRLEGDQLLKDAACDLAEQHLLKDRLYESVSCEGEWAPGPVSRLEVEAKPAGGVEHHVFCFARAHRWYVLMTPGDGKCPAAAPPAPATAAASLDEEEDALRAAAAAARAKALVASFGEHVDAVRQAVEIDHEERPCAFKREVTAAYVDYDALPGAKEPAPSWELLTHADFAAALDQQRKPEDRAKAIDSISGGGGYVVVFQSDEMKELPKATGGSFLMGEFDGWLSVVELSTGKLACETRFKFINAQSVGGGVRLKYAPKKSTQELADDDFEDKFEAAAKAAATKLGGGKLKLKLGFLN